MLQLTATAKVQSRHAVKTILETAYGFKLFWTCPFSSVSKRAGVARLGNVMSQKTTPCPFNLSRSIQTHKKPQSNHHWSSNVLKFITESEQIRTKVNHNSSLSSSSSLELHNGLGITILEDLMDKLIAQFSNFKSDEILQLLEIIASRQKIHVPRYNQKYNEFWNQIQYQFLKKCEDSKDMSTQAALKLYHILASLELDCNYDFFIDNCWQHLLLPAETTLTTMSSDEMVAFHVQQVLEASKSIRALAFMNHLYRSPSTHLLKLQSHTLKDSRPFVTFLNHFFDSDIAVSLDVFAEVFHSLTSIGLFSPEFLSVSLLLYRRRSFELTTRGAVLLLHSVGMILSRRIIVTTPDNIIPCHWVIRSGVAEIASHQSEMIKELKNEPRDMTWIPEMETHPEYYDPDKISAYSQEFFDQFEELRQAGHKNIVLGESGLESTDMSSSSHSNSGNEQFVDITDAWNSEDNCAFTLQKRMVVAESSFLMQKMCTFLKIDVKRLDLHEAIIILRVLAGVPYMAGSLITELVEQVFIPQISHFKPVDHMMIVECLHKLNVRNPELLKLICNEMMIKKSEYDVSQMTEIALLLHSLNSAHTELLMEIKNRMDELFRRKSKRINNKQPIGYLLNVSVDDEKYERLNVIFNCLEIP